MAYYNGKKVYHVVTGGGDTEETYNTIINEQFGTTKAITITGSFSDTLYLAADRVASTSDYDSTITGSTLSNPYECSNYITIDRGNNQYLSFVISDLVNCTSELLNNGQAVKITPTSATASFTLAVTE